MGKTFFQQQQKLEATSFMGSVPICSSQSNLFKSNEYEHHFQNDINNCMSECCLNNDGKCNYWTHTAEVYLIDTQNWRERK